MARVPTSTAVAEPITNNGLRFMNSAWNDTIANGELYNLNWDRSLHGIDSSLGVYQISYLEDGIIAYKLAVDITQHADDRIARWTPRDLDDGLYVFWLQTIGEDPERWAISPPWEPSEPRPHDLKWATPIGIPIAVMMGIYFISLVTCLLYRRKKKARSRRAEIRESERRAMLADQRRRRQQEDESEDPLTGDRHPSVSSLDTASTSVEEDVAKPECVVIYEKSPRRSSSRRPSHSEVIGQTSQSRRPSHTEPFPQVSQGRRPSQPESFRSVSQSRRPSQPESFRSVSQSRRPSQPESFRSVSQSRRPSQSESLHQVGQNRRPSHPDLFHQVSQRRRPSHPDLFQVSESRLPSHPDLFRQVSQSRRPSHPELFIEIRSTKRRPSRPDLSDEVSPTRRPSQAETFIDGLPATEVGMAL